MVGDLNNVLHEGKRKNTIDKDSRLLYDPFEVPGGQAACMIHRWYTMSMRFQTDGGKGVNSTSAFEL